jgi:UDP-N-acetylglucosamine 2-epimerase (non-hydrolysing)/GDP/UDP-N,N'-diacetylbacillosamine 2-epimerase (hydrolysing)
MREIAAEPALELQVVVTGAHLSPEFGSTHRQIASDGFTIDATVDMLLSGDTPAAVTKSMGLGVIGFADALARVRPSIVVVLGDRYEIFAAAQAAMVARLPIAHIHGGEVTEGVFDDPIRHSITKMAHLHFVAAEPYRARVVQLGEDPARVFNFGTLGIENIRKLEPLDRGALEADLGIPLRQPTLLVTYHPVTLDGKHPADAVNALCIALDRFPESTVIITGANADTDGRLINARLQEFAARNGSRAVYVTSLGQRRYLSAMMHSDAVVGNSSSGIIEAPAVKTATVNIGARQGGRLKAASIIDCADDADAITRAIGHALSPEFRAGLSEVESLYGSGDAAAKITQVLKEADLEGILIKPFHDVAVR